MIKIASGQYLEGQEKRYPQGIIFDIQGAETMLLALYDNPIPQEIIDYEKGEIKLKVVSFQDIIFFISKMGNSPWMESPFNVHLVQNFNLPENKTLGLTILLVDAVNGLVKASRWVNLEANFSRELAKMITRQQDVQFEHYDKLLNDISSKMRTADILALPGIESSYPGV